MSMKSQPSEHPIIFTSEMVRAILDGRKTQTRRVIKPQPTFLPQRDGFVYGMKCGGSIDYFKKEPWHFASPDYKPGDRLWVRETWCNTWPYDNSKCGEGPCYRATDEGECGAGINCKWRPSIFMPRWASRITLEVTGVRAERVRDITSKDARSEGIINGGCLNCGEDEPCGCNDPLPEPRESFVRLWNSINAKRGCGWDSNPWVWVIEFKRIDGQIWEQKPEVMV